MCACLYYFNGYTRVPSVAFLGGFLVIKNTVFNLVMDVVLYGYCLLHAKSAIFVAVSMLLNFVL